jgi:hypothetical protein
MLYSIFWQDYICHTDGKRFHVNRIRNKAKGGTGNLGIETYDKIYNVLELSLAEAAKKMLLLAKPEESAELYSYA